MVLLQYLLSTALACCIALQSLASVLRGCESSNLFTLAASTGCVAVLAFVCLLKATPSALLPLPHLVNQTFTVFYDFFFSFHTVYTHHKQGEEPAGEQHGKGGAH